MPVGAALSEQSSGEGVTHFGSLRIRVDGIGQLQMAVFSLDDLKSKALAPFTLALKNRHAQTRIVNFVEQRATFEIKTTELGERFRINRIIIFTREIYKSFPGN